ncbi:FMN-binding protein [Sorangium sp. So ce131]|uniref:FMN-binding protein n=1 Tax=Sorangium sp. So ce131 TaxID=3133282 RepID=UPI003F615B37
MRSPFSGRTLHFAAGTALAFVLAALPAHGATYWTVPAVLKSFFASSKKVGYRKLVLSDAEVQELGKKLGAPLKREWVVYVAESEGKVDGYAIKDEEKGMHEPIDFAVKFSTAGAVERIEILEYREAYGDEVRGDRFRAQFHGKTASDPITAGKDIDIVSGASISSRSVALGVKRDALVLQLALKRGAL